MSDIVVAAVIAVVERNNNIREDVVIRGVARVWGVSLDMVAETISQLIELGCLVQIGNKLTLG